MTLAASVLSACSAEPPGVGSSRRPPDLILYISLDTLRADRLGSYGHARDTSPRLDEFARSATLFEIAVAQASQTLVSHKSVFTSNYPARLIHATTGAGLAELSQLDEPTEFLVSAFSRPAPRSLVELLAGRYRTEAFVDGGWMRRQFGFDAGFHHFDQLGGGLEQILPRLFAALSRPSVGPQFFFVHAYDIHCPYPCRSPFNEKFCARHPEHLPLDGRCGKPDLMASQLSAEDLVAVSDHYDGGIASADAYLGELFDRLRQLERFDESLVIVSSDHGESLGEHGQIGHGGLYLEQLLVPLLIKFPAAWGIPAGRIRTPVELVDILPTLLDAAGLEAPAELDGRSLLPLVLKGDSEKQRRVLVAQTTFREGPGLTTSASKRALLVPGRWLFVHDARGDQSELFDLSSDPRGSNPLAPVDPGRLEAFRRLLERYDLAAAGSAVSEPASVPLEDETLQQLRALGYLGN